MIETLRALGEPNRFHIVELLREGPRPVGEMVERLGLQQPQVSKHLRVLSEAGWWTFAWTRSGGFMLCVRRR